MIRKMFFGCALLYALLIMYSLFVFDRNLEEIQWKLQKYEFLNHVSFENIDNWTFYNIRREGNQWTSTTNDPIVISPEIIGIGSKYTLVSIEMKSSDKKIQVFWKAGEQAFSEERSQVFTNAQSIVMLIDSDLDQIRIDPAGAENHTFHISKINVKKYR
jgi:hypothetical protein